MRGREREIINSINQNLALTPIILATHEAEIRRIMLQIQPQANNSSQDPISKKPFTQKC
jgi:hypothetical protein